MTEEERLDRERDREAQLEWLGVIEEKKCQELDVAFFSQKYEGNEDAEYQLDWECVKK